MLSSITALFLLLPIVIHGQPLPPYPTVLGCNNVTGDTREHFLNLSRPFQNGDEIIWRGTVWPNAEIVRFDIYRSPPQITAIHIRQDFPNKASLFTELPKDAWLTAQYGQVILSRGEKFELSARLVGNNFEIRKNGQHVYTYVVRYPASLKNLTHIDQYGQLTMTSIEMKCAPPGSTPAENENCNDGDSSSSDSSSSDSSSSDSSSSESSEESC